MTDRRYIRVHADPSVISALKRDGFGWGHDLTGGSVDGMVPSKSKHPFARIKTLLKG